MTVAELGDRMSSRELTEWQAFYGLEPFGDQRADLRQAITTSTIANGFQSFSKNPKKVTPEEFMPFRDEEDPEPPTPHALRDKLMAAFGRKR